MTVLQETIGRQALIALSNQYASVADALMELIDNPFDYRKGRHLAVDVWVDKNRDEIRVFDHGGQGMDAAALGDWIAWGTGHEHATEDIGQFHVGGKLASIYLAESLEITSRKAGDPDVYRFVDGEWGSRTTLFTGRLHVLSLDGHLDSGIRRVLDGDRQAGFAQIRMKGLKPHRYEVAILEAKLGNTYRQLLLEKKCTIRVNGNAVAPLDIPYAPSYRDREVVIPATKLSHGVTAKGRIWITDREKFKVGRGVGPKAGIRTVFNGRLITVGEEFGHYLAGRGSLQRLVGEIELSHIRPNTTKDGWDQDSPQWQAVHVFMNKQMQPLITFLNSVIEGKAVNRQQRKRAEDVRRSVEETLKRLRTQDHLAGASAGTDAHAPAGRAPAQAGGGATGATTGRERGEVRDRTEPPEDAIGRLLRRVRSGVPPIEFDDLGRTSRTQLRQTDAGPRIIVNTSYPLYERLGETEEYLAETVFLHLLVEDSEIALTPKELGERLDQLLFVWAEVMS